MTITTGSVVLFDYTLTDDEKDIIDSSKQGGPLAYLHGEGQIVKGLEKVMEGKKAGDTFSVTVSPEEGYGLQDPAKIAVVTADQIEGGEELEEGMQLEASNDQGEQIVVVSKIEGAGSAVTMGIVALGATLKLWDQFSCPSCTPRVSATFLGSPFRT